MLCYAMKQLPTKHSCCLGIHPTTLNGTCCTLIPLKLHLYTKFNTKYPSLIFPLTKILNYITPPVRNKIRRSSKGYAKSHKWMKTLVPLKSKLVNGFFIAAIRSSISWCLIFPSPSRHASLQCTKRRAFQHWANVQLRGVELWNRGRV